MKSWVEVGIELSISNTYCRVDFYANCSCPTRLEEMCRISYGACVHLRITGIYLWYAYDGNGCTTVFGGCSSYG